jgi:hypothetical protein
MILIPPTTLEWDSSDAAELKKFLSSSTGLRMLEALAFMAPELTDGVHAHKALVASGRVHGYQDAMTVMVRLTREDPKPPAPQSSPNYPDLDADDAWKDLDKTPEEQTS